MSVAVYPGSFDPITNGHLDVIARASRAFDRVVVGVLANPRKQPLLSVEERVDVIRSSFAGAGVPADRVDVRAGAVGRVDAGQVTVGAGAIYSNGRQDRIDGLTVEFCHAVGAAFIVRGLRAISDFESEMQLAHNNRKLARDVDTVFFMTALEHGYVSSSLVKEIASFGGDVAEMVPSAALAALRGAWAARGG